MSQGRTRRNKLAAAAKPRRQLLSWWLSNTNNGKSEYNRNNKGSRNGCGNQRIVSGFVCLKTGFLVSIEIEERQSRLIETVAVPIKTTISSPNGQGCGNYQIEH